MRLIRSAFTVLELLVVITIILILSGLLLSGSGLLRDRAKIVATNQRMQQVLTGLSQYSTGADLAERLQRMAGFDRKLVSLRSAISLLTDKHGLDLVNATKGTYPMPAAGTAFVYPANGQLPPGIGNRWENARAKVNGSGSLSDSGTFATPLASRRFWPSKEAGTEDVITFMDRQIGREAQATAGNSPTGYWPNLAQFGKVAGDFWMMVAWDDVAATSFLEWYGGSLVSMAGGMTPRRGTVSTRGETLKGTLEILPDAVRSANWYSQKWPNLVERLAPGSGGEVLFYQQAWPESDWDQSSPGSVPVVWHWPWGKSIYSRTQGAMISQIEYRDDGAGGFVKRTLADLNPLATITLLQAAGVIAPGIDGATAYRSDRGASKNWNDAWGGPLVVVNASFFPARYDYDDVNDTMMNATLGLPMPKDSRSMLGGRDLFVKKSAEVYQYSRTFYAAVGATGKSYPSVVPSSWAATDDPATLRNLWVRIRTATNASDWTGESFSSPAWTGVRNRRSASSRCFITTPAEFK